MASPQCEDGFTKIANELLDALIRTNFSGYQRRVLDSIIRKTYGFNKKEDWISNSQIVDMTGIKMPHVSRALKELRQRRIVTKGGNKTAINKDYNQWQQLPKGVSSHHKLPKGVTTVTKGGKKKLPKGGNTKDTLKDNVTKDKSTEPFQLPDQQEISEAAIPKIKADLEEICKYLYENKIFTEIHAFKNKMLKEKKSERAILHALVRCALKKEFKTTPWAYCIKIMGVEDGNYNEYEFRKDKG